jgi:hypothetical protein
VPNKQIWEEAFMAGFKYGYANARVGEVEASNITGNAEAAYQNWLKESGQRLIDAGGQV